MSNPNNCATCEWKAHDDKGHCYMFFDEPNEICMQHTDRKKTTLAIGAGLNLSGMVMLAHSLVGLEPLALEPLHDDICASKDGGMCDCPAAALAIPEL